MGIQEEGAGLDSDRRKDTCPTEIREGTRRGRGRCWARKARPSSRERLLHHLGWRTEVAMRVTAGFSSAATAVFCPTCSAQLPPFQDMCSDPYAYLTQFLGEERGAPERWKELPWFVWMSRINRADRVCQPCRGNG